MKKKKIEIRKFDLVIYICIFITSICLVAAVMEYYSSLRDDEILDKDDFAITKITINEDGEEELVIDEEPESVKNCDKKQVVGEYFEKILDRIIKDDVISYDIINTWNDYEVIDGRYIKEITTDYYMYEVDIKINNKDAKLPKAISGDFSNDEYNVITLNVYIFANVDKGSYIVKKIEV